ncbi:CLUMA_CG001753, isoform A [Clunio marinus]|uniref:CLUMA_CG001753, isoform A n=1 Tax=Clunio marinus TaxID=568069 RepID=A0A1J1HIV2_9DIPT|nr:CLUMA_CG001753, isoform A [Clunio marinus]
MLRKHMTLVVISEKSLKVISFKQMQILTISKAHLIKYNKELIIRYVLNQKHKVTSCKHVSSIVHNKDIDTKESFSKAVK